ncbi:MAG: CoA transferase [Chloroflexi bacterium]|nr:CoA transferase [Chloroflexota bacterium]GIW10941.1 MAG: CoA transferase [Dehalococcoidia bacterium]
MNPWLAVPGALQGIRVLDYTTAWAGPRMTAYLAEMGAQVIHVESIQYLDTHRGWSKWAWGASGNLPNNEPGRKPWERNSQFNEFNKNKLGITLNLADPRGVALFRRLAALSDVVVDNYKAGTTQRFGIDYAQLRQLRPDIIQVSLPAFGTTGPYRDFTAWGNQVTALTGHGLLLNYAGEEEPEPGGTYGDPIAAITGALAVVAALYHRQKTGQGQYLEIALSEVMPPLLPEAVMDYVLNGRQPAPVGNSSPTDVPWNLYPCQGEDAWIAICCASDAEAIRLFDLMERPDLAERFATLPARLAARQEIDALVAAWTAPQEKWALADRLQAAGIAAEPASQYVEVLADPQLAARGFFVELDHPECGVYPHPLQAVRLSKTPPRAYRPAPTYGQHNRAVLGELLGLSEEELVELERERVIGNEPLEDEERRQLSRANAMDRAPR